jgi:hypothetical protein
MKIEVKVNANARVKLDSEHFGEIIKGIGEMSTQKIIVIGASVIIALLAYNLPELLTILLK